MSNKNRKNCKGKTSSLNATGEAESWTLPAFMKFLRATIETLHGFSDDLLKIAPIKSMKSKRFEINFKKVGIYSTRPASY